MNITNVSVGQTYSTTQNNSRAAAFLLRNDGNARVNVSIVATALFSQAPATSGSYRYNVTNASANTSANMNCSGTNPGQNTWYNMPIGSSVNAICNLDYTDANDYINISIQITVPSSEGGGDKQSTATFTGSQA